MNTKSIVFIDERVSGYEALVANLGAETEWFLLDAEQDGVTLMQTLLAGHTGLESIQVISHGSEGALYLGSTVLNGDTLSAYQTQLQAIGSSLTETGDILLYGCNVAQSDVGSEFMNLLARITGADIAASIDLTGGRQGNWMLEKNVGAIESKVIENQEWSNFLSGPSIIQNDTVWHTGETINLSSDIQIAQGATLTIQQGVTINGNGHGIQAFGTLQAVGTMESQIVLNDTRFLFGNSHTEPGRIELRYAEINNGAFLPATGNASYGSFALTDSVLNSVDGFYIWYPTSSSSFERNIFLDCSGLSIGTNAGVQVLVSNNMFSGQVGAAIENWASYGGVNTVVSKNSFLSTDRVALSLADGYSSAAMHAENNYFGTTDIAIIETMIHDRSDTLEANSFIDYDPILLRPDTLTPHLPNAVPGVSLIGTNAADSFDGGEGDDTLTGLGGDDMLNGSNGDDSLIGGEGNDNLDGGGGSDEMVGGNGNDRYTVRDNGDMVTETNAAAAGGMDTVHSYLAAYTLGANVENGRILSSGTANLTGNALGNLLFAGNGNNTLNGQAGVDTVSYAYAIGGVFVNLQSAIRQDTESSGQDLLIGIENLTGSKYNDHLSGNAAANVLNGSSGADVLIGRDGNDVYYVDHSLDAVIENSPTAAGGMDTVISYLTAYTLGNFVENGRIMSTGAANLTGNSLNNVIDAGKGSNVMAGGSGTDTLSYAYGANGTTGVKVSLATTSAQATGGSGTDTISGFERLTGSANSDSLTGNGGANLIRGGNGNDTVIGGGGNDTLYGDAGNDLLRGGAGNDILYGGAGKDLFRFDTALGTSTTPNIDTIKDFSVLDDTIQLENAIFKSFGTKTGVIGTGNFKANLTGRATDSNDYIIYETDTGKVFYDADGSGAAASVQIALVGTGLALSSADFVLV